MWIYFFMFLALVIGALCGMGGTLLLAGRPSPLDKPEKKTKKQRKERVKKTENSLDEPEPEAPGGLLAQKLPAKDFSVADFMCAADGYDSDEHIAARQQQQDNAYNALKSRKSDE